jgi:hypothetical protein
MEVNCVGGAGDCRPAEASVHINLAELQKCVDAAIFQLATLLRSKKARRGMGVEAWSVVLRNVVLLLVGGRPAYLLDIGCPSTDDIGTALRLLEREICLNMKQVLPCTACADSWVRSFEGLGILLFGGQTFISQRDRLAEHINAASQRSWYTFSVCQHHEVPLLLSDDQRRSWISNMLTQVQKLELRLQEQQLVRELVVLDLNDAPCWVCPVAFCGWLLDFPVLYDTQHLQGERASDGELGNCLGGQALKRVQATWYFRQGTSSMEIPVAFSYPPERIDAGVLSIDGWAADSLRMVKSCDTCADAQPVCNISLTISETDVTLTQVAL